MRETMLQDDDTGAARLRIRLVEYGGACRAPLGSAQSAGKDLLRLTSKNYVFDVALQFRAPLNLRPLQRREDIALSRKRTRKMFIWFGLSGDVVLFGVLRWQVVLQRFSLRRP